MFNACSPPTAYCLLHDFCNLKSGDVVVQNGATSAVGLVSKRTAFFFVSFIDSFSNVSTK